MKSRFALMLLVLMPLLSACGAADQPVAPAAAPAGAGATTEPVAAPMGAAGERAGADAAIAPADGSAPDAPVAATAPAPPTGPAPVAGVDYIELANGQPYAPLNGQIEVVEVFGYTCGACAQFEPLVKAWKARQPADVRFTPVPAAFGGFWIPYARAYYAAEILGLREKTHEAMFNAVHVQRSLPVQGVTAAQLGEFYARHGGDAKAFVAAYESFGLEARLNRAKQFAMRSQVDGTPTLVVNGKYTVQVTQTGGWEGMLNTVDHLVARERAAAAGGAQ